MLKLAGWIAALLIGTGAGHAAPIAAYTGLAFLGDSLTDTGNEYARTKGKRPPDSALLQGACIERSGLGGLFLSALRRAPQARHQQGVCRRGSGQ